MLFLLHFFPIEFNTGVIKKDIRQNLTKLSPPALELSVHENSPVGYITVRECFGIRLSFYTYLTVFV
jgi:hypothetical protein